VVILVSSFRSSIASKSVAAYRLTFHLVIIGTLLQVTDLDAASDLGEQSQSEDGYSHGNFLVARNGSRDDDVHKLALSVKHGASIVLKLTAG